jgi:hypothetical protein
MKKVFPAVICMFLLLSCKENAYEFDNPDEINRDVSVQIDKTKLKYDFSVILSKAVAENVSFRKLIREEALKKFDNDHDVLYQLIKGKNIDSGETVRELLLGYCTEKELTAIEQAVPLLTILVPTLPEDCFTPDNWDTDTDIPAVAVELNSPDSIRIIKNSQNEYDLSYEDIPGFPVVVVKECERIVLKANSTLKSLSVNNNGFDFDFVDSCFNGLNNNSIQKLALPIPVSFADPNVREAHRIYENYDGWQRDYIYYTISPAKDIGIFVNQYYETITSFMMKSDVSRIGGSPDDPTIKKVSKQNLKWSDGNFEFLVTFTLNGTNIKTLSKYFDASFEELYDIEYKRFGVLLYRITKAIPKEMSLNIPVFSWDLEKFPSQVHVSIEEVDPHTVTTIAEEISSEFAANFEIEAGLSKKVGLKFGASAKTTRKQTISKAITTGNDKLGDFILDFADPVIKEKTTVRIPGIITIPVYYYNTYSGGNMCEMTIIPKKQ